MWARVLQVAWAVEAIKEQIWDVDGSGNTLNFQLQRRNVCDTNICNANIILYVTQTIVYCVLERSDLNYIDKEGQECVM